MVNISLLHLPEANTGLWETTQREIAQGEVRIGSTIIMLGVTFVVGLVRMAIFYYMKYKKNEYNNEYRYTYTTDLDFIENKTPVIPNVKLTKSLNCIKKYVSNGLKIYSDVARTLSPLFLFISVSLALYCPEKKDLSRKCIRGGKLCFVYVWCSVVFRG